MSTFRLFKTFLSVVEYGSFAAAADRVALTPAAVGLQMRSLENELRCTLFRRSGRHMLLTDDGASLVPKLAQLLRDYEGLLGASSQAGVGMGPITVAGIISSMAMLSCALVTLKASYPQLEMRLLMGQPSTFSEQLRVGKIDAAICVQEPGPAPTGTRWSWLYDEPLMVVANAKVAGPHADPIALLQTQPFIRFERKSATGIKIDQILRKQHIVTHDMLEINSLMSIVELVRQAAGITIVPILKNSDWLRDTSLCILPLPGRQFKRSIGILERDDRVGVTAVLREHLRRETGADNAAPAVVTPKHRSAAPRSSPP